MKFFFPVLMVMTLAACQGSLDRPGWTLVWHDEFDQGKLDSTKWSYSHGNGSAEAGVVDWGNGEQQAYEEDNVRTGFAWGAQDFQALGLQARSESRDGKSFTSGRIHTSGKFHITGGRVEARIKVPKGRGLWPAFWMLGEGFPLANPWPGCGEIDILEVKGGIEDDKVHGTVHFGTPGGSDWYFLSQSVSNGKPLYEDFHTYAVEWDEKHVVWFLDDRAYHEEVFDQLAGKTDSKGVKVASLEPSVFRKPFFIILCLAVGGGFVDGKTPRQGELPAEMAVDYVRVYKKSS